MLPGKRSIEPLRTSTDSECVPAATVPPLPEFWKSYAGEAVASLGAAPVQSAQMSTPPSWSGLVMPVGRMAASVVLVYTSLTECRRTRNVTLRT